MSVLVTPLGVIAGIYLHEYAQQGTLTRVIRIAVNNLAGVPSIVYGVFGLGFFVYGLGSWIDTTFYTDKLPEPTFGSPMAKVKGIAEAGERGRLGEREGEGEANLRSLARSLARLAQFNSVRISTNRSAIERDRGETRQEERSLTGLRPIF